MQAAARRTKTGREAPRSGEPTTLGEAAEAPAPAAERQEPAVRPPPPLPAPLPQPLTSLVGRAELIRTLTALLLRPDVRLLTLYGPGGAGKSRVAIELASRVRHDFGGDVCYVSLGPVRDPALVASSLAIGLGVQETVGLSTVQAMQRALADRRGLLLIDNFEHLVEAAPVIADLVQAAPQLTVLVTSRSVLRLSGEVVFPIPPLELPAADAPLDPESVLAFGAVRLFVDRARAADPHFAFDAENAAAVVEICRRVDALPLAIELAAARVRALPPPMLLARMTRRLPLLSGGPRDAPARQRTLRDAIDWSVALLDPFERTVFARLSTFEGGGTRAAIEAVLGDAPEVLEAVGSLIDKSLLRPGDHDDEDRVSMLETLREYAAERLEADPDAADVRERHARTYLELAEAGGRALKGGEQAQWLRWLVRDIANLRAAMTSFLALGETLEALRLATALRPLFMARCHYEEGQRLLVLALAAGRDHTGSVRASALLALGALTWRQGDLAASLGPIEESLETYRAAGDLAGTAAALRLLGVHAHNLGDYGLARARFDEALTLMRRLRDDEGVANTLLGLGNVAFDLGDAAAVAHYEESRAIAVRIGDTLGVAYALDNLSALAWCRNDLTAAAARADEAEALYERLEHPLGHANVAHRRGLLALARRDLGEADVQLRASLDVREAIGEIRGSAFVRYDLARVSLAAGRLAEAREHLLAGLDLAERHGAPLIAVLLLEGVAAYRSAAGEPDEALEVLATATEWRRRTGVPICRVNESHHAALRAVLDEAVEPAERHRIEARGAAMGVFEAVAQARAAVAGSNRSAPAAWTVGGQAASA